MAEAILLEVTDLRTVIHARGVVIRAVDGVSVSVDEGESLAVVGESGCGKTMMALSIVRLIPRSAEIVDGSVVLQGEELLELPEREMEDVRGNVISMIFQDPQASLNPLLSLGHQLAEVAKRHQGLNRKEAREAVIHILGRVGLPDPSRVASSYPHTLSGGMRQRSMIAMALMAKPKLLIADEPTTALDVTVQAQILALLRAAREETGMGLIMITHDLGVVAEMADRVVVMYAGRIVESAQVNQLFLNPAHPYTQGLHTSTPNPFAKGSRLKAIPGSVATLTTSSTVLGCKFYDRCSFATDKCREVEPPLEAIGEGTLVRCWHHEVARDEWSKRRAGRTQ